MKAKDILQAVKSGKQLKVRLTNFLWDDSWGEKGMVATITSAVERPHEGIEIVFNYNEEKDHNLSLQTANYFLREGGQGTAFEAGLMKIEDIHEDVWFEADQDVPVELIEGNSLFKEFKDSESKLTYVEWLEERLSDLRKTCNER